MHVLWSLSAPNRIVTYYFTSPTWALTFTLLESYTSKVHICQSANGENDGKK